MSWRFILTRNRWQKALSIFLATMIWLTVRSGSMEGVGEGSENERDIRSMPVAVLAAPSDAGVYRLTPSTVTITLQVDAKSTERVSPEDLEVYVNVMGEDSSDGLHSLHVHAPEWLHIRKVVPRRVEVKRLSTAEPSR